MRGVVRVGEEEDGADLEAIDVEGGEVVGKWRRMGEGAELEGDFALAQEVGSREGVCPAQPPPAGFSIG